MSNWFELCGDDYIVILWNGWWYLIDCWSPLYNYLPNGDQYGCGEKEWYVNATPKYAHVGGIGWAVWFMLCSMWYDILM